MNGRFLIQTHSKREPFMGFLTEGFRMISYTLISSLIVNHNGTRSFILRRSIEVDEKKKRHCRPSELLFTRNLFRRFVIYLTDLFLCTQKKVIEAIWLIVSNMTYKNRSTSVHPPHSSR